MSIVVRIGLKILIKIETKSKRNITMLVMLVLTIAISLIHFYCSCSNTCCALFPQRCSKVTHANHVFSTCKANIVRNKSVFDKSKTKRDREHAVITFMFMKKITQHIFIQTLATLELEKINLL